jgi:hypothetical protein
VNSLLTLVLHLATTLAQHAPQVGRSDGGNSHVSTPGARRMQQETGNSLYRCEQRSLVRRA